MDRYGYRSEELYTRSVIMDKIAHTQDLLADVQHGSAMLLITKNLLSNLVAAVDSLASSEMIADDTKGLDEELVVSALDTLISVTDTGIEPPAEIGSLLRDQLEIFEEWGASKSLVRSQFESLRSASYLLLEIHRGLYGSDSDLAAHAATSVKMTHGIMQAHWVALHDQPVEDIVTIVER